jgi:aspartate carbamoyltransferase regulatory subunit
MVVSQHTMIGGRSVGGGGGRTDASMQYRIPEIAHDPTLPHVNNIPCPNRKCSRATGQPNRVLYLKYDEENMLYVYFCVYCQHFWSHV